MIENAQATDKANIAISNNNLNNFFKFFRNKNYFSKIPFTFIYTPFHNFDRFGKMYRKHHLDNSDNRQHHGLC